MNIKPMLISEYPCFTDFVGKQKYVFIQPKLDGWRAIYDKRENKLYTRSGEEIKTLPHINTAMQQATKKISARYVDGEIYKHGYRLSKIQSGIKKGDTNLQFHVFDFVLCWEPYLKRSKLLSKIIQNESVKTIENHVISPVKIDGYYQEFLLNKYEGAIVRVDGIGYEQKRSENILKIKPVY